MLVGREGLLTFLHSRLTEGVGDGARVIALHGLGGAGKTSIAVEYAHQHLVTAGLAWQFAAQDRAVLAAEFGRLAALLGASGGLIDPRDPVASVHAVLAASSAPWLLIFDDVPDQESVRPFLPPAGNGQVLITSQSALWPPGQALEVPVLDTEVAARFLTSRTGDLDEHAAGELAAELGGLPLALEQAGAYIQATGGSLAGYLEAFRRRRPEILTRGDPIGYGKTVTATWMLAFSRVEEISSAAVGLLRFLSCCAPEPVPLRLLLQPRPGLADQLGQDIAHVLVPLLEDSLTVGDAITALRRFSLVTPTGDGLALVHRLVQAITLDHMPGELADQWRHAAAAVIEAAIPQDTNQSTTWPVCRALLPHAQVALAEDNDGLARIANYLRLTGSYTAARDLWQKIWEGRQRVLGSEHPDTLSAWAKFASLTGWAGDRAGARDLYATVLPVFERILGAGHPDTLTARDELARWTGDAGDPARARDLYTELVSACEQALGPEDPTTLSMRAYHAIWTGEAGDPATARDLYTELLPVMERVQGPEGPGTLITRHNLAGWIGEAGDPATARDLYTELLPVMERVQGPEGPGTLITWHSLAFWTARAGHPAAARDLLARLLPVVQRVSGAEHPLAITIGANLARWTGEAGDPIAARNMLTAVLPVLERVFGAEHPRTLTARHDLARWTGEAGEPAAARDMLTAVLPVLERVSGAEHPRTLTARHELARWTGEAGEPAGARNVLAAVLPAFERVLGDEHPDTLTARDELARWTGHQERTT